jgi:opacity protein-like surface antigen
MNTRFYFVALVLALVNAASAAAQSADTSFNAKLFGKKHMLSLGTTRQATTTTFRATRDNADPVSITLDELGADKRDTSYFIDYRYRVTPNWSLFAGTYQFTGSGGSISERDFNFDGVEFTAGAELQSKYEVDVYMVNVLYTVHRSDRLEVMLGGGLHAFDLSAEISGNVTINEQAGELRKAGSTLLAPVPNLRGSATWALTDRFGIGLVGGWLSANVGDYSGDFVYAHLRGYYRFTDSLGVSLGYQLTNIDIERDRARSSVAFNSELDGPSLTLTYSF